MRKEDSTHWGDDANDSRVGRRPFLGSLGFLGAAGLGGVGTATADHVEGWPNLDDPYYADLVAELEGMGLPPATFVHADTESGTREAYWRDAGDVGTIDDLDVSEDDVPFGEAMRITVTDEPENSWDVQVRTANWHSEAYRSVEAGQVLLGVASLRAPEGEGTVQYVAENGESERYNSVATQPRVTVGSTWERYYFPIEFEADADWEAWSTQFHFGYGEQTVDLGGIALLDFGRDVDASDLPGGTGADDGDGEEVTEWPETDDPYYRGLIDELDGLNLSPGRFVYGDTEADAFAAFELDGSRTDDAATERLEVGDDVPFSEAIRVEITGEMDDPWDVNFKGIAGEQAIDGGDVLLGVAYLRTPDEEATIQHQAKDEDNEATNMSVSPRPSIGPEWERYFFPIRFTYDSEPGAWWTEFFLGYEGQTVDIGGLALLYFAGGVDVDDLPAWDDEDDDAADEEWETAADERIDEHRTAELTVDVTDADGNALEGAVVDVAMQDHEYGFGTAVNAPLVTGEGDYDDEDVERVRELTTELFNTAVLENYHKWRFWEDSREIADAATEWVRDQGLSLRGHAGLWASVNAWAVPPDVVEAMGVEWEDGGATDPDLDPEYVRERSFEHLESIVSHYGDEMIQWDVVNEVIHEPAMIEAIDGEGVDSVEAPVLAEWYRTATEVAPEGVSLDVNDYNVLVGPYESTRDAYERQIEFLANADGVDLGGVGMQCHFSRGETLTPSEILEGLDRYAGYGADLRVTEFDMSDPNWDEEEKATFFYQFLKTVFSHPDTTDFLLWGFWDEIHWQDDAPLFYDDWEPKPAYDVWVDLVFEEWWTEETGETDSDGAFSVTGFKGDYEVTVSHDGIERTATATLSDGGETLEVTLDPDADDGDDTADDGDDSDTVPGFGAVTGLAALAGATGYALLRTGDDEAGDDEQ